jgi:hypothetical protein
LIMARVGNWSSFTRSLVDTLGRMPGETAAITLTLGDIQKQAGTQMTLRSLADPLYWQCCREGRDPTSARAGLSIKEHSDPSGAVFAVTYRLARAVVPT